MTTARRLPHTPAAPHLTGGDDQPLGKCHGNWLPFDMLIDREGTAARRYAAREAVAMCAECPLRSTCLVDNADESWAQTVIDMLPHYRKAATDVA